jgi:acetyltransferase
MFRPRAVALIGASARPGSIGNVIAKNLLAAGFAGPIGFVNPRAETIEGRACVPDVDRLPDPPDLAVIATPPDTVPDLVARLAARGCRAAVVITAGFGEGDDAEGAERRRRMFEAARPHLLRIVGPNCVGIQVPGIGLNASFVHMMAPKGQVAFVAQSGAVVTSVVDWAAGRGIGFSHLVSLGDMADVDFGDMLDYLAADTATGAVLLYVEAVTSARKFLSAARACARVKPVIVIKTGRHAESARAAASHTGALAGSDAVYDAAFRRAGIVRVYDLRELFDAVETLSAAPRIAGDRLAILTNGGGAGVLATDALIDFGGRLAALSPATLARLDAALPRTWSRGNPVDIIGDAGRARYEAALAALLDEPEADAVLVLYCPVAVTPAIEPAEAVVAAAARTRRAVLTCWLGEGAVAAARRLFAEKRIPSYATPAEAVRGFMHLVRYQRGQRELMEAPPALPEGKEPDRAAARASIERALADGREWLTETEAKSVLAAYGIPVAETATVATPEAAAEAARRIGLPAVVKIVSPDIVHKSDVGGVALGLETADDVARAAAAMLARVKAKRPDARIEGFAVEPMIRRAGAVELILGMTEDTLFGPVILFGHGGVAVEVIDDKALALPPLNLALARALMAGTRVRRLMEGVRGAPPAAIDQVAMALVRVSQLVIDFGEVAELDVNPLLADATGIVALDARIRVARARRTGEDRLAIRPYPRALEGTARLKDGRHVTLRPVKPEDGPALQAAFKRLSARSVRFRFFHRLKSLSDAWAARLTQIDYDREMAILALDPAEADDGVLGVVRMIADPDNERAEYAIVVRDDVARRGLGEFLMRRIIDHARARGTGELVGDVMGENASMLALAAKLGFSRAPSPDDPAIVRTRLILRR